MRLLGFLVVLGATCAARADAGAAANVTCVAGTHFWGRVNGKAYCVSCPAGTGSAGCTDCVPDPDGTACKTVRGCAKGGFHDFLTDSCKDCPAGKWQSEDGKTGCWLCPKGRYQDAVGKVGCYKCAIGMYEDVGGAALCKTCNMCAAGRFGATPAAGADASADCSCKDCQPGTYSPAGFARCGNCPAGRFQPSPRAYTCYYCPTGKHASVAARSSCVGCPPGRWTTQVPQERQSCNVTLDDYEVMFRAYSYKMWQPLKTRGWTLVSAAHLKSYQDLIKRDIAINKGVLPLAAWSSSSCCMALAHGLRWDAMSHAGTRSYVVPTDPNTGSMLCNTAAGATRFAAGEPFGLSYLQDRSTLADVSTAASISYRLGTGMCRPMSHEQNPALYMAIVKSTNGCTCGEGSECMKVRFRENKAGR
eukprot:g7663.t1